jgi:hypothetical protein
MKQVDQTLDWNCSKNNATYRQELHDLRDSLNSRMLQMYQYGEADVNMVAAAAANGNYTWFLNHNDALYE